MNYYNETYSLRVFLLLAVFCFTFQRKKFTTKASLFFSLLFTFFLSFFFIAYSQRNSEDYFEYEYFYSIISQNFWEDRFEFGYKIISFCANYLGLNFRFFYATLNAFGIFIICSSALFLLKKIDSRNSTLFLLAYFAVFFVNFNNIIIRTMLAVSFVFLFYNSQRLTSKIIYACFSISFHYFSLIAICLIYLNDYLLIRRNYLLFKNSHLILIFIFLVLSILIADNYGSFYINLIDEYFTRYSVYNNPDAGWFDSYSKIPITQIFSLIFCFLYGKYVPIKNLEGIRLNNLVALSVTILILIPFPAINSRIFIYFLPFFLILTIKVFDIFKIFSVAFYILFLIPYFLTNFRSVQ